MAVNEKVGIEIEVKTGSLKAQLREATQELARLQGSATASAGEIAKAAKRAAELKDRIGDAKATIEAFDPDAKFKSFGQSIQGVAGAFAATQGALALVGIESKDVEKQLLKVQGALALSEGLNTVLASVDGFKNLGLVLKENVVAGFGYMRAAAVTAFTTVRGAIIATGVGLLAVGLGLVIANFEAIKQAVLNAVPGLAKFGSAVGDLFDKITDYVGITNEAERALDKFNKTSERRKESLEGELRVLEASGAGEKSLSNKRKEIINEDLSKLRQKLKTTGDLTTEEYKKYRELNTDLLVENIKYNKKSQENNKKAGEEASKANQDRIDAEIAQEQKKIDRLFELSKMGGTDYERKLADLKTKYDSDLKLFGDSESAKALAKSQYDQATFEATKAEKERLKALDDGYADKKIAQLEKDGAKQKDTQEKVFAGITATMNKSIKKQASDEVQIRKLTEDEKLGIISNAVQVGIKVAGEGTVVGKALAIADATINTYVAANKALSTLPPPFSFIAAGATIASGLLNVQQILSTEIPSSAGVSSSAGGGSIGGAPPMTPRPEMAVPTELGASSLNTIQNVVARAYVVESDISGSQQRISRIQNAARF